MTDIGESMLSAFEDTVVAAVQPLSVMKKFIISNINNLSSENKREIGKIITKSGYTFQKISEGSILNLKLVSESDIVKIYKLIKFKLENSKI